MALSPQVVAALRADVADIPRRHRRPALDGPLLRLSATDTAIAKRARNGGQTTISILGRSYSDTGRRNFLAAGGTIAARSCWMIALADWNDRRPRWQTDSQVAIQASLPRLGSSISVGQAAEQAFTRPGTSGLANRQEGRQNQALPVTAGLTRHANVRPTST